MIERQNLSVLYAPLHPNDGTVEFVSLARAAGNQFVRRHILAQSVPTARTTENRFFRRRRPA